jgi:hypothetical protein
MLHIIAKRFLFAILNLTEKKEISFLFALAYYNATEGIILIKGQLISTMSESFNCKVVPNLIRGGNT